MAKLAFVLLIIANYTSFVTIAYSYFTTYFRYGFKDAPYSLRSSALLGLIQLCSFPFMVFFVVKQVKPIVSSQINNKIWSYLWVVPATFCLSYYYNLYSNGGFVEYTKYADNIIFAAVYNLGALIVTFLVSHLVKESNEALQLRAENYILNMQAIQYEHINNRIEETRRAKHDLRQILTVIRTFLNDHNTEGLEAYIVQYTNTLPSETPIRYCGNYVLNALLVYYGDLAHQNKIAYQAKINYPTDQFISDVDMVILFGNLLENAVEACIRSEDQENPFISVQMRTIHQSAVITVDNSYSHNIHKNAVGQFISSKGNRIGIGIDSIHHIAEKYHGIAKFMDCENVFMASVYLNIDKTIINKSNI